jgi:hypothetical protein
MKNIETPLTWGLGVLVIVLLVLNSLNNTVVEYNISDTSSDLNSEFNLDHDHQAQEASSFNIQKIGVWGDPTCSEILNDSNIIVIQLEDGKVFMDTIISDEIPHAPPIKE